MKISDIIYPGNAEFTRLKTVRLFVKYYLLAVMQKGR